MKTNKSKSKKKSIKPKWDDFKAFKFRIYPNKNQEILINKTIGCSRFVFNFFLAQQKKEEELYLITEELFQNGTLPSNNYKSSFFNKVKSYKENIELKSNYLNVIKNIIYVVK